MKKTYMNALFGGMLAFSAVISLGCGENGENGGGDISCPSGMMKVQAKADAICVSTTNTDTSTETGTGSIAGTDTNTTGTGGVGGSTATATATATVTATATSAPTVTATSTMTATTTTTTTATSAWKPNEDCNIIASDVAAGPGRNIGLWPLKGWNICIKYFGGGGNVLDIEASGYAYKADEFKKGDLYPPPSAIRVSGVIGRKCVLVKPTDPASGAPTLQGNGAITDANGVTTISDGVDTVTWQSSDPFCQYDYEMVPKTITAS